MTESGHHPIGMFFSRAAKIVTLEIKLNLHFVCWHSWLHCSTISNFSTFPWINIESAFVQTKWDLSNKSIVFMDVEISIFISLNISKNKTQSNVDLSGRVELVEDFFKFLVDYFSI